MRVAGLICEEIFARNVLNYFPNDTYFDSSILQTIYDSAPTLEDTLIFCSFLNNWTECNKFFPSITSSGICYTFNGFNMKDLLTDE